MYKRRARAREPAGAREPVDDVLDDNQQYGNFELHQYQQDVDLPDSNDNSEANLLVPVAGDERAAYIAGLLREADLSYLIQLDPVHQLEYFLSERLQLMDEIEHVRIYHDKHDQALRQRLDEAENENDRLMAQHRSLSKQLVLYRNLVDAPESAHSTTESKDYEQLKRTIEEIVQENERLYAELNYFKTSDPVYEQVQLLETANMRVKQQLNQALAENGQLQQMLNLDEINYLKSCLLRTIDECEQLRLTNKRLVQQQISFSKQVHVYPSSTPPSTSSLSNQLQLSPISTRSCRSVADHSPHELAELHEHVHRLEQTLQQRDYDLQKLQNHIERGTSSIMSSIEDLCTASSKIASPTAQLKPSPSVAELQNEVDQLHDRLDELGNENQLLRTRLQEVDTIYEENQYLYEEKNQWAEEMEHARRYQLALVQEINAMKQHADLLDAPQMQEKMEQLSGENRSLEDEVLQLREQLQFVAEAYERDKQELLDANEHYKQILQAGQHGHKLPKKLTRMVNELEERIRLLEEDNNKKEQKSKSLHDAVRKLQDDMRQKELEFARQMDNVIEQRDALQAQLVALQQQPSQDTDGVAQEEGATSTQHRSHPSTTPSSEWQEKYDRDIAAHQSQIASLRAIQKQMTESYDADILKSHQAIIQLQHQNNQCGSQLEHYRSTIEKLQTEVHEKQNFIQQVQHDLSERSALYVSIHNQLSQENKAKTTKIVELERMVYEEQQNRMEAQQRLQDLLESHAVPEQHPDPSLKRELLILRSELTTKSDENSLLRHSIHDEKLRRNTLETKLKRLKQEYMEVRAQLYTCLEESQSLQYELIECRLTADYYSHANAHTLKSPKSSDDPTAPTILQLYLKEKSEHLHCQLSCRTYRQQIEYMQKSHEQLKQKYKQRHEEEKRIYESDKIKYAEYIRNIQRDLQETRQLLAQDAEIKLNQQAIDDRTSTLLINPGEIPTREDDTCRENALLTTKIHSLEQQMKSMNDRIERTAREQNELRRDVNNVRLDVNVSSDSSTSSSRASASPVLPSGRTTTTYVDATDGLALVYRRESVTVVTDGAQDGESAP